MRLRIGLYVIVFIVVGIFISVIGYQLGMKNMKDTSMEQASDTKQQRYTDHLKFSVDFPEDWTSMVEETWEATSEREASPDGGINIYIDGNVENKIYVYWQNGHISYPQGSDEKDIFTTDDGLNGELYEQAEDKRVKVQVIYGEGFHGAHVDVSEACYKHYKNEILEVIKSMKILE